jgi:hypothetical protein
LFGKTFDFDDYEDWIKCVEQDEHMRNVQFTFKKSSKIYNIFHLNIETKTQDVDIKQKKVLKR